MTSQKKNILLIYASVAALGLILLISGYSFSIDLFDYLLVGTLILTPVIFLIIYLKKMIVRIVVSLLFLFVFCFVAYIIMVGAAFSSTHQECIKTWKVKSYRIELTYRQAWAGPPYYQYDLKRVFLFGIFDKTIYQNNPGMALKDTCIIEFPEHGRRNTVYRFDQCKETLEKSDNKH